MAVDQHRCAELTFLATPKERVTGCAGIQRYGYVEHWIRYASHAFVPQVFRDAAQACRDGTSPWPMFVWGDAGAGKTVASIVMASYVQYSCYEELSMQAGTLHGSAMVGGPISATEYWRRWSEQDLTVLDEIDIRDQVTGFRLEVLKRAIDARDGRPAILISNVGLSALAKIYDDRIASRLRAGTIVHCTGDQRKRTEMKT